MSTPWTPNKMITKQRVVIVAQKLFHDEEHYGDCKEEAGRIGQPCRVCLAQNTHWLGRLTEVRRALFVAFGHDPDKHPEHDLMTLFPEGVAE